jgi:hypothetical protein
MYKLSIVNEVNGRTFGSTWESQSEKDAYLDKLIAKQSWGKNQRIITEDNMPEELRSRIISTQVIPQVGTEATPEALDEEGNVIIEAIEASSDYQPERTEHTVKADYVITEVDLSQDIAWRNEQKVIARKKEYKSIEEVIHIILDHGMDSQEFIDMQTERSAIKARHPKE